jgi:hypothetical protein
MRKAKMSFQSGQVKQVIRTYAVEVQTGDRRDLDVEAVTLKLRKAMGANCKFLSVLIWEMGFELSERVFRDYGLTVGRYR